MSFLVKSQNLIPTFLFNDLEMPNILRIFPNQLNCLNISYITPDWGLKFIQTALTTMVTLLHTFNPIGSQAEKVAKKLRLKCDVIKYFLSSPHVLKGKSQFSLWS